MTGLRKNILSAAVASALGVACLGSANAASIASMTVTDGSFGMGIFTSGGFIPFSGIGSDNDIVAYSSFSGNNTAQPVGNGGICAAGTIACFDFGAGQLNVFLASGSSQLADGTGRPTLAGQTYNENGGTSTVDLSGWYANWSITDFNQGNSSVTLTTSACSAGTCTYSASWTSLIVGGSFSGNTGSWRISGTVSGGVAPIPVPSAVWLMSSGVVGLIGVARRRRL